MKRLRIVICAIIAIALLSASALAAQTFNPKDAQEARLTALEYLKTCCFEAEYGSSGNFTRWKKSIDVYVVGNPTYQDITVLDDFLMELALRVPNFPNIRRVENEKGAEIVIYYVALDQMGDYIDSYVEGNWGYFSYHYNNYVRNKAQIAIATDVTTQYERNHLIKEELFGALGPSNDHYEYSDSIIYQEWTTVQTPSEFDWILMNMMYSPLLSPGISYKSAYNKLYNWITE